MRSFNYIIDNNTFAVKIYPNPYVNSTPLISQPYWPNGTPWGSYQEAESWALLCIQSIENPAAPYAPAGPGLIGEPKIPEQTSS